MEIYYSEKNKKLIEKNCPVSRFIIEKCDENFKRFYWTNFSEFYEKYLNFLTHSDIDDQGIKNKIAFSMRLSAILRREFSSLAVQKIQGKTSTNIICLK